MTRRYTVAEARTNLPALLREAEDGRAVEITRRGRPVAVVVSLADYRRIVRGTEDLGQALERWQRQLGSDRVEFEREYFDALRDRSSGRKVRL